MSKFEGVADTLYIPLTARIKSQLLKLLVIFPAVSALAAWICSLL